MNGSPSLSRAALVLIGLLVAGAVPAHAARRLTTAPHWRASQRAAAATARSAAQLSDPAHQPAGVEIAPAAVVLDGPRAIQHLVVTATMKDGTTCDVTDRVRFVTGSSRLAKVVDGVLVPVADGATHVVATLGRLSSRPAEVTIRHAQGIGSVTFVNDVMPILAKAGCNSSACHGSPTGKAGFKLSLFGYEPALDHTAIVQDGSGRRVNLKDPARSLILLKPTMSVPHGGGPRFKVDSPAYRTLLAWLKAGAPGVAAGAPRITAVRVVPEHPWMPAPGATQRLVVTAVMSDGSTRDVTDAALFSSNDDAVAGVDEAGRVSARRPGETAIMIRYLGQVAVSRVAVLPPWKLQQYPRLAQYNVIDQQVQAKLRKLRVVPSDLCTDAEFIRRATLDTCGLIPTTEEVRAFVADRSPDKRARLVDRLLERPEFVDFWTLKWNDTLRNNPRLTRQGLLDYSNWIREQIARNRPYDQFVRELLTASGKNADVPLDPQNLPPQLKQSPRAQQLVEQINGAPFAPAANYFVVTSDPLDLTSATSQTFLGVRIECARCHNHPFERWTQNDYYHLAAFFTGIRTQGTNQTPRVVSVNERAVLRHPVTNEVVEPRTLDGGEVKLTPGQDRRAVLADWITSPANPFFAREAVNRLWAHYFGRGIVEPVDDFRVTNPPSNPELLDALAKELVDHQFDLKQIHRLILTSRTYQQSSRPNQYNRQDTNNFARFYPRRMMAEQLYDSISQATGVFLQLGNPAARRPSLQANRKGPLAGVLYGRELPDAESFRRVAQLPAVPAGRRRLNGDLREFLDTFGKPRREVVCECERSNDGNIGQALALLNGDEVNAKIAAPAGRVQQLIHDAKPDAAVIDEIYLSTLSRPPTAGELAEATQLIRASRNRAEGIEDLMWSLLNSREFLFNH
jgi:hypothetical protein